MLPFVYILWGRYLYKSMCKFTFVSANKKINTNNMEKLMKAVTFTAADGVKIQSVPRPEKAEPSFLLIKMEACAINPGDIAFMGQALAANTLPKSRYDIWGVSGVGTVVEAGDGVPPEYIGKNVTVYRSLQFNDKVVGTWCQYAHLHYRQCAILPSDVNMQDYAGTLVNTITPYAFLKQIIAEGHKGIITTAGTSATGIAMLGICHAYNFPLISIVRTEDGKKQLEELGAQHVAVESSPDFKQQLKAVAEELRATAVFDGIGGELLTKIVDVLPNNTTVYCYGYLGGKTPLTIHTSVLMRGITFKGFGNFRSETVQNPEKLETALADISNILHMPHFKTKIGKAFTLDEINEALMFTSTGGGKAVLYPFG